MLFHEWCYHVISTYSVIISNELLTGCYPASAKIFSMWEWCIEKWLLHYTFIWASLLICSSVLMTRLSPPFIFCLFIDPLHKEKINRYIDKLKKYSFSTSLATQESSSYAGDIMLSPSSGPIKQGRVSSLQSQPFGLHCSCRRDGGCARTCMFSLSKAGAPPG